MSKKKEKISWEINREGMWSAKYKRVTLWLFYRKVSNTCSKKLLTFYKQYQSFLRERLTVFIFYFSSWSSFILYFSLGIKLKAFKVTSLEVQWLGFCLLVWGLQVWSLVGELRSHMPLRQKKKTKQNIKQKQYCNKFNKD